MLGKWGESGGGVVLEEPFEQSDLNRTLSQLASDAPQRDKLRGAALVYAAQADIYDCTTRFAEAIEVNFL